MFEKEISFIKDVEARAVKRVLGLAQSLSLFEKERGLRVVISFAVRAALDGEVVEAPFAARGENEGPSGWVQARLESTDIVAKVLMQRMAQNTHDACNALLSALSELAKKEKADCDVRSANFARALSLLE